MAKKSASPDPNGVIQFRPGESFGRAISDLAGNWGVSRNEVVRRLALLAWAGLTIEYYRPLNQLARSFSGPNDFLRACDYVRGVLASLDRDRQEQMNHPLQGKERIQFVERCVEDLVLGRQIQSEPDRVGQDKETSGMERQEPQPEPYRKIRRDEGKGT